MTPESFRSRLLRRLGSVPDGIAVMGKWEPFLPARRCVEEVTARAAATLAIAEALQLEGPTPYLLSAEAWLRRQPRPGCQIAAQILVQLGACPERIRLSAAANRTSQELQVLERMRRELRIEHLLCVTAAYHAERARSLAQREGIPPQTLQVVSCDDEVVRDALTVLPGPRRQELQHRLAAGRRPDSPFSLGGLNERLARLGAKLPLLERLLADWVRGPAPGQAPITGLQSPPRTQSRSGRTSPGDTSPRP